MTTEILCGAGIFPFCISDTGNLLFVLGKEHEVQNWKGSEKWSAFEGGTKDEEDSVQNACREFCEETLGILTLKTREQLETEIKNGEYAIKLKLSIDSIGALKYHVTYVKQFEYNPELERLFQEKLEFMREMIEIEREFKKIEWEVMNMHPFHKLGDVIFIQSEQFKVSNIQCKSDQNGKFFTMTLLLTSNDKKLSLASTHEISDRANMFIKWCEIQAEIRSKQEIIRKLEGAVLCNFDKDENVIQFRVNHDFMEKSMIKYWSVEDLKYVIEKKGKHNGESFRSYFMHVLKETLVAFSTERTCSKNVVHEDEFGCNNR